MAGLRVRATPGTITLPAAARTALGIKTPGANHGIVVKRARVTFKGVSNTAVPALVEFCTCTFATQGTIGTNNTTLTLAKVNPLRTETIQSTAGYQWTTEPTVVTPFRTETVPVYQGMVEILDTPLEPLDPIPGGTHFVIRITAPAGVDCDIEVEFDE